MYRYIWQLSKMAWLKNKYAKWIAFYTQWQTMRILMSAWTHACTGVHLGHTSRTEKLAAMKAHLQLCQIVPDCFLKSNTNFISLIMYDRFHCFISSPTLCIFWHSNFFQFDGCELVPCFNLYVPGYHWGWAFFHKFTINSTFLFCELPIHTFCSSMNRKPPCIYFNALKNKVLFSQ